jgi:hypothetical protein
MLKDMVYQPNLWQIAVPDIRLASERLEAEKAQVSLFEVTE